MIASLVPRVYGGVMAEEDVPEWARFFTASELARFYSGVEREMQRRDLVYELGDGLLDVVLPGDRKVQFGLLNLAQLCNQVDDEEWETTIHSHFANMLAARVHSDDLDQASFEDVRSFLKLRIYPEAYGQNPGLSMVGRTLAPGLMMALVYDLPTSVATVHPDHVAQWPLDEGELMALALENVAREDPVVAESFVIGDAEITSITGVSFFAATHALMLERHVERGRHGALLAVPNRHLVLYHAVDGPGVVAAVQTLLAECIQAYDDGPGSISSHLYWLRSDEIGADEIVVFPTSREGRSLSVAPTPRFVELLDTLLEDELGDEIDASTTDDDT